MLVVGRHRYGIASGPRPRCAHECCGDSLRSLECAREVHRLLHERFATEVIVSPWDRVVLHQEKAAPSRAVSDRRASASENRRASEGAPRESRAYRDASSL